MASVHIEAANLHLQSPIANLNSHEMSVATSPHVVVVGGGIIGSSIGWHLSHNASVTFVAEDIGGTATPNSFAWL